MGGGVRMSRDSSLRKNGFRVALSGAVPVAVTFVRWEFILAEW